MFDYQLWIEKAVLFALTKKIVNESSDELPNKCVFESEFTNIDFTKDSLTNDKFLPFELKQFWVAGFCKFTCTYESLQSDIDALPQTIFSFDLELEGGAMFINPQELSAHLSICDDWAEKTWIAEYPLDKSYWQNSLPFIEMNNGDYLAVDISDEKKDPAVIYLSHDNESFIIGETFSSFLNHWEKINYAGPEWWSLEEFFDENRHINSELKKNNPAQ